jgi:hypothetical protein
MQFVRMEDNREVASHKLTSHYKMEPHG